MWFRRPEKPNGNDSRRQHVLPWTKESFDIPMIRMGTIRFCNELEDFAGWEGFTGNSDRKGPYPPRRLAGCECQPLNNPADSTQPALSSWTFLISLTFLHPQSAYSCKSRHC